MAKGKREIKIRRYVYKLERAQAHAVKLMATMGELGTGVDEASNEMAKLDKMISVARSNQNERFKKIDYHRKSSLSMGKVSPSVIDQLAQSTLVAREQELMIKAASRRSRKFRHKATMGTRIKTRLAHEHMTTEKRIQNIAAKIKSLEIVIKKQQDKEAAKAAEIVCDLAEKA